MKTNRIIAFPFGAALALVLTAAPAWPRQVRSDQIAEDLVEHHLNPAQFMRKLPRKRDGADREIPPSWSKFSAAETASGAFVIRKSKVGPQGAPAVALDPEMSPIVSGDHASDLTGPLTYESLSHMLDAGVTTGKVEVQPWSSDYWPIYQGIIGQRYTDPLFPSGGSWKDSADFVLGSLGQSASSIDDLSPAEKYDLLVGDPNFTLTRNMFEAGRKYFEQTGSVETWMGICHGWAPASYRTRRPSHRIELLAADGVTHLSFYPDDIKALASALWANGSFSQRFIGHRCSTGSPDLDPTTGHITDPACLDTNPGTWHLAIVNHITKSHEPFVMDASLDYQVWNQPVVSYSYSLFNPKTQAQTTQVSAAKVVLAEWPEDPYKKWRSSNAYAVVGVAMDVEFLSETTPIHKEKDGPEDDSISQVRYLYDIETDQQGRILGGEWYSYAHPDFLWTPAPGSQALTPEDKALSQTYPTLSWDGKATVPAQWQAAARKASRRGTPLAKVVNALSLISSVGL